MSDPEIRELERRVADGDASARLPLATVLLRAGRPLDALFTGTTLSDAGIAAGAASLTARARARLARHLAAVEAARVVKGLRAPITFGTYRMAQGGRRALVARPQDGLVSLALEDASQAPARERRWWRRDYRLFYRPFPVEVPVGQFGELALAFLKALGGPFPESKKPSVVTTEGDYDHMDEVETTWSRGPVRAVLNLAEDHMPHVMESADRRASGRISGLPGRSVIDLAANGNASAFERFSFSGTAPGADRALEALGEAFTALLRGRARVHDHLLAPEAWLERAAAIDVGRFLVLEPLSEAWAVEERDGARFAFGVRGELPNQTSYGERGSAVMDPVGPVPRSPRTVRVHGSRIGPDAAKEKPELATLVPSLLGAPLPEKPEARRREGMDWVSRWRVGPWVIQESKGTSYDDRWSLAFRIQEETGGTWALFFTGWSGATRADANAILVGDEAATREPEARMRDWLGGWKLNPR